MPIDYSKWDRLELSDDEDFECSPYVDKPSMVRFKQAQIHLNRRERKDRIKAYQVERELYTSLVVPKFKATMETLKSTTLPQFQKVLDTLYSNVVKINTEFVSAVKEFRNKDRDPRWESPQPIPFFEERPSLERMVEEFRKLAEVSKSSIKEEDDEEDEGMIEFKKKMSDMMGANIITITNRIWALDQEIKYEEEEDNKKITSDNIFKETANKTLIVKEDKPVEAEPVTEDPKPTKPTKSKKKQTTIETIHDPTSKPDESKETTTSPSTKGKKIKSSVLKDNEDTEIISYPPAATFAEITDLKQSYKFINQHPELLKEVHYNEILAEAFRTMLKGDMKFGKQCIHQSLVLQYASLLGVNGVPLFFKRLETEPKAQKMFYDDLESTFTRIKTRVAELNQKEVDARQKELENGYEQMAEFTEELPDGTLVWKLGENPSADDIAKKEVFDNLPPRFRRAIFLQDVDEMNAVFEEVGPEKSKEIFENCGRVKLMEFAGDDEQRGGEADDADDEDGED